MVPQGQCLNLYSCTFAGHFSLHKNKLLVPRGNQLLRHSWKMLSTLLLWTLVNVLLIYGYAFHAHARGVTPIGAVSRAATGVKMRSNVQGTFWGSVKRSSSVHVLGHYLRHYWRSRGVADPFAHAQLIDGQGSRAKIRRGQAVKAIFRQSKILTPVAALDTVPMKVTPPCSCMLRLSFAFSCFK